MPLRCCRSLITSKGINCLCVTDCMECCVILGCHLNAVSQQSRINFSKNSSLWISMWLSISTANFFFIKSRDFINVFITHNNGIVQYYWNSKKQHSITTQQHHNQIIIRFFFISSIASWQRGWKSGGYDETSSSASNILHFTSKRSSL